MYNVQLQVQSDGARPVRGAEHGVRIEPFLRQDPKLPLCACDSGEVQLCEESGHGLVTVSSTGWFMWGSCSIDLCVMVLSLR